MNESKVVRYEPEIKYEGLGHMSKSTMMEYNNGTFVTHADYRALEEELAALRGQYEMVRQCCMDETVRATRLMGDLEAMRTLVEGSLCAVCDEPNDYDTTSRVCRRCQDVDTTRTPKEQTK